MVQRAALRPYARIMYDLGMDMLAISQNLGHADIKTTQGYVDKLGMADVVLNERSGKVTVRSGNAESTERFR